LITILGMMSSSGLLANDIFLPVLPQMSSSLNASPQNIQLMLILFLLAMGVSQLIYVQLSNALGRRTVLLSGMVIFFLSSLSLVFLDNYENLLLVRVLQGIGACSGIALARAIVGDMYSGDRGAGVIIVLSTIMGVMPGAAPLLGSVLTEFLGWKSNLVFTAIYAFVLWLIILVALPESRGKEQRQATSIIDLLKQYMDLGISAKFWKYASVPCFAYAAYFSYVVESAFILERQGLSIYTIGLSYIPLSITYVIASVMARRILHSKGADYGLKIGYLFFWLGGVSIFLVQYYQPGAGQDVLLSNAVLTVTSMAILTFGNGFLLPLGTMSTLINNVNKNGLTPALLGFFQFVIAALVAQMTVSISGHDPVIFGFIIVIIASAGISVNYYFMSRMAKRFAMARQ